MRCFGLCLLNYKIWSTNSVKGISVKSFEAYAIVFSMRLLSIFRHQGYLPFDKSGDWFYHFVELMSLAATLLIIYAAFKPLLPTYDAKNDKFGHHIVDNQYGVVYIVVPAVFLAIFFHPNLNREFLADTAWTTSMYLEAVAMVPQLYMFQKSSGDDGGVIETLTGHMVFALSFARVFELLFWLGSHHELVDSSGWRLSGYLVLLSQLGHLAIMGDFFYYYFISLSKGSPMVLPTANYANGV
jgi:hypothetical protein